MSGEINRRKAARFYNRAMTNEEIQQRYRATVRRGRIFVFLVCPVVLGLVILVRPLGAALGIEVGGTLVLVLWLIACAALAIIGVNQGEVPKHPPDPERQPRRMQREPDELGPCQLNACWARANCRSRAPPRKCAFRAASGAARSPRSVAA